MVLSAIDQGSLSYVFSLSFTSWCELCLTSCCTFTAVWALFPLFAVFQPSSVISSAPFSLPMLAVRLVLWILCEPHSALTSPSASSFVFACLDSTQSQIHCNVLPLQASQKEGSILGWNALPPCVEAAWTILQDSSQNQGINVMLWFMLRKTALLPHVSVFQDVN